MLGSHGRIVETRGHGMRREHLSVRVLQDEGAHAVEDADGTRPETGRVLAGREAAPPGLDADHLDARERQEFPEEADRVRAPPHARDEEVGQLSEGFAALREGLPPDHGMETVSYTHLRAHETRHDLV